MRYAIVSDIHANLAAWQTVLNDIADLKADKIICLGDVVGYGPQPVEVLESVYRVVNVTLMGNHDAAVCGRLSTEAFSPRAAAAVSRHRELLAPAALEWLSQLPLTHAEPGFRCAHSDFADPSAFRYIIEPDDALPSWQATTEQLLFVGHSHLPGITVIGASGIPHFVTPRDFELEKGKRYIVNPGSIGYPRVGDCRSSYCLFDDVARSITFRQLPFDSAGYRQAMQGAGLDDDPWIQQKEQQQHLPTLRESPDFAKPRPAEPPTIPQQPIANTPPPRNLRVTSRLRTLAYAALAVCAILAAGVAAFNARRPTTQSSHAVTGPDSDMSQPLPRTPPEKPAPRGAETNGGDTNAEQRTPNVEASEINLLPPLPETLNADGAFKDWHLTLEDRTRQTLSIGLRDAASTLCIHHTNTCKAILESPLIALRGSGIRNVRLRARVRKPEPFSGTVSYHVIMYTPDQDGTPKQSRVKDFEMLTSKRKLSPPGADRDVRIPLVRSITHARLRIEATFEGTLEIEQPTLLNDPEGTPK